MVFVIYEVDSLIRESQPRVRFPVVLVFHGETGINETDGIYEWRETI